MSSADLGSESLDGGVLGDVEDFLERVGVAIGLTVTMRLGRSGSLALATATFSRSMVEPVRIGQTVMLVSIFSAVMTEMFWGF